jgi:dephospho-CoA kinase
VAFERGVRTGTPAPRPPELALAEPDPSWEAAGARLAARVARAAGGSAVRVDHIGSTSVPGLVAKDVVDLQLVVAELADADAVADSLAAAGFPRRGGVWWDTPKPGTPSARWEKRLHGSADPGRAVNLHVRAAGAPGARYALLSRDWLRSEPAEREGYAALKRRLAGEHALREDYAEAKEPWFTDVAWPRMEEWATRTGWVSPV